MIIPPAEPVLDPLQTAMYARMVADETLLALLGGAYIYDEAPETQRDNYVTIGEVFSLPDNAHDGFGAESIATLHVWSRYRGFAQGLAIAGQIQKLFDHRPLDVAGHEVIAVHFESAQTLSDPDPQVRHIPIRFRIFTEQE